MDKGVRRIEKSKDGVPIWDGDASSFQEFEEAVLLWEQGTAVQKRYLSAPRLIAELTGSARRHVMGQPADWVSYNGGVRRLLEHLRSKLGLPQLPELTDHLTRLFKQGRRRRGETMNEYITRKTECYMRAQQSLGRVLRAYGNNAGATWSSRPTSSRPGDTWSNPAGGASTHPSGDQDAEEDFHEALL